MTTYVYHLPAAIEPTGRTTIMTQGSPLSGKQRRERICYTIGHSVLPVVAFVRILKKNGIDCIIDVRTAPYSRHNPQFNREHLQHELESAGIEYLHCGAWLGGRYDDVSLLYPNGVVNYAKVRRTARFREGIDALLRLIDEGVTCCVLCAEKDPLECHRFSLISYSLQDQGVEVWHLSCDQARQSNRSLEEKLRKRFASEGAVSREDLYELWSKEVARAVPSHRSHAREPAMPGFVTAFSLKQQETPAGHEPAAETEAGQPSCRRGQLTLEDFFAMD